MKSESKARRVAIIDNSLDPSVYRPVDHWNRHLPVPADAFTAREGRFPDPRAYSHLILTGSEASILERQTWVDKEAILVREAIRCGVSVLGSCWGHQLLAFALAGPRHVRRCAHPEIGWISVRITRESELLGPAGEFFTFSVHFDEVCDLPKGFEVLAETEACPVQAFRVQGKPVWGLQPHPEVDIASARRFLEDLIERGFKGMSWLKEALRSPARDSGLIERIVDAFLA